MSLICKHCTRVFSYKKSFEKHEATCKFKRINKILQKHHFKKEIRNQTHWHKPDFIYVCKICDCSIKSLSRVVKHDCGNSTDGYRKTLLTKLNGVECFKCKKLFPNFPAFLRHKVWCSAQARSSAPKKRRYMFECHYCTRQFVLQSACQKHIRMHKENPHMMRGGGRLDPEKWGYSEKDILLNSPDYDEESIEKVILIREIKNGSKTGRKTMKNTRKCCPPWQSLNAYSKSS